MQPEILAPVGSRESLEAALRRGRMLSILACLNLERERTPTDLHWKKQRRLSSARI